MLPSKKLKRTKRKMRRCMPQQGLGLKMQGDRPLGAVQLPVRLMMTLVPPLHMPPMMMNSTETLLTM